VDGRRLAGGGAGSAPPFDGERLPEGWRRELGEKVACRVRLVPNAFPPPGDRKRMAAVPVRRALEAAERSVGS
jgi:hypothetical protein